MEQFYRAMRDYAKSLWEEADEKDSPTAEHYKEEYDYYQEKYFEACTTKGIDTN